MSRWIQRTWFELSSMTRSSQSFSTKPAVSAEVLRLDQREMFSADALNSQVFDAVAHPQSSREPCACPYCQNLPAPTFLAATAEFSAPEEAPPFPLGNTFLLNSRPSATKTIYLDFDGSTISGTAWQSGGTIVTPAFDFEGGTSTFTNNELERIQRIWQRVAEDYSPFDINITTQQPSAADLNNTGGTDTRWGTTVAIGGTGSWYGGGGGVGYVGTFGDPQYSPAFVFSDNLFDAENHTADAISHEAGHNLGLDHDGRTNPVEEYYDGQGSWGPIMGSPYGKTHSTWSNGDYANPSNTQDDVAIIASVANGVSIVSDEAGETRLSAAALGTVTTAGVRTANQAGVISQRVDVDWFSFTVGAGTVSLSFNSAPSGPNLNIHAELYNSAGTLLQSSNPVSDPNATISLAVTAGTYYVRIDGVGEGNPLTTGFSDYGSLGQYTITGTLPSDVSGGSISGRVVNDANGNRVNDSESGISGVTVSFDRDNDNFVDGTFTTSTDGTYSFTGLVDGLYRVFVTSVAGYVPTSPATSFLITVSGGSITSNLDFFYALPVSVSGRIFNDTNGNGTQDGAETGSSGVTVFADVDGNGVLNAGERSVNSTTNGDYSLLNVAPGTFTVRALLPAASTVSPGTPAFHSITATGSQSFTARNFARSSIAPSPVFSQIIDDGATGFSVLSGTFNLASGPGYQADIRASTAAPAEARWQFNALESGQYRVMATFPAYSTFASAAGYSYADGTGSRSSLGTVDQRQVPRDIIEAGVGWRSLGIANVSSGQLNVFLSSTSQTAIADAIRIERIPAQTIVVEDGDAAFSAVGSWQSYNSGGNAGDFRLATPAAGTYASWRFTGLLPGRYQVAATWVPLTGIASDAPYSIVDRAMNSLGSAAVDQTGRPLDFIDGGIGWKVLSTITLTSDQVVVQLGDPTGTTPLATGLLAADAVRLQRIPDSAVVIDNSDFGFGNTPGWNLGTGTGAGRNNNFRGVAAGTGSEIATWTFRGLTPGQYRVSGTWPPFSNRATNAKFAVLDGIGGVLQNIVTHDQRVAPNDFNANGSNWEDFGQYTITGDTLVVRMNNSANNYLTADAIRVERVAPQDVFVDDGDPGFSTTGDWSTVATGRQGDSRVVTAAPNAHASWNFRNLIPAQYRVYVTWTGAAGRSTAAPYQISNGETGQQLALTYVNQTTSPSQVNGFGALWNDLGLVNLNSTALSVKLLGYTSGTLSADTIWLRRVGPLPGAVPAASATPSTATTASATDNPAGVPLVSAAKHVSSSSATPVAAAATIPAALGWLPATSVSKRRASWDDAMSDDDLIANLLGSV